jgi:hypothetical protein
VVPVQTQRSETLAEKVVQTQRSETKAETVYFAKIALSLKVTRKAFFRNKVSRRWLGCVFTIIKNPDQAI